MSATRTQRTIEAVWRIEAPRIIGALTRMVRDVALAEDLAQEALVAALERWPDSGIPDNPGAWLMTAAKRRAIDQQRRAALIKRKHEALEVAPDTGDAEPALIEALDDEVGDDLLRLMLITCHPILSLEARVALTLRLLGGLTTEEIARATLTPEPTLAQRIVRAKRTLSASELPFELPRGPALGPRLGSVFEVIYLIFNEGYSATRGDNWMRPELCADAMRLGRILVSLLPHEAEAHGLLALMELQASRTRARHDASGAPILLLNQDRARWDHLLIQRGLSALARAHALSLTPGPYTLQAALAACHARARTAAETDWQRIVTIYDALLALNPSPVIKLNRAVALSMSAGAQAAIVIVDELVAAGELRTYHLLPSVRAELLARLGRIDEARDELERAIALTKNSREQAMLKERLRALSSPN